MAFPAFHDNSLCVDVPPVDRSAELKHHETNTKVIDLSQPDKWLRGNSGFPNPRTKAPSKADDDDEPPSKAAYMLADDKQITNASLYRTSDHWVEGDSLDFPFWNLQGTKADDPEYLQLRERVKAEFCRPGQVPIDLDIVDPDDLCPVTHQDTCQDPLASLYPKKVKGKTILAFLVKEGVIVAADHIRGSVGTAIIPLNSHILAAVSGDDIDQGRALLLDVRKKCYGGIPVEDAAKLVSEVLVTFHGEEGLSLTTIIAGRNKKSRSVYRLDGKGALCRGVKYTAGSGYQIATVNVNFSFRADLTAERGIEIGKCAICRAGYRASETGGFASGYYIGASGWRKVFDNINIEDTVETQFPDQFDGRRFPLPH
ncbi:OLC1v1014464C1 [Oldenlandia corymbosa var. corymbosa]|nr:OLC1v1014464C1 [Oldenlandia corymbosa var. corymbosa]